MSQIQANKPTLFLSSGIWLGDRKAQGFTASSSFCSSCTRFDRLSVLPFPSSLLRQPLIGFSAEAWILILVLTLTAQLLGHSLINKVLATTSATVVSLAILFELPASTIIAAVALGQVPPWGIIPAAALIVTGLVIVIRASDSSELTEAPPV